MTPTSSPILNEIIALDTSCHYNTIWIVKFSKSLYLTHWSFKSYESVKGKAGDDDEVVIIEVGGIFIFSCPHHNQSLHCVYSTIFHSREEKNSKSNLSNAVEYARLSAAYAFSGPKDRFFGHARRLETTRETSKKKKEKEKIETKQIF